MSLSNTGSSSGVQDMLVSVPQKAFVSQTGEVGNMQGQILLDPLPYPLEVLFAFASLVQSVIKA